MKVSVVGVVGLVLLGLSALLGWTHLQGEAGLAAGVWAQVEAEVLEVKLGSKAPMSGFVTLRWAAADGSEASGAAFISREAFDAGRYRVGDRVSAWVHPGFPRPELSEAPPDLSADQRFTKLGAIVSLVAAVGLLGFAFGTGRFFAR